MKKILLVLAALSALSGIPAVAHANVSIGINTPGLSLNIGDRDPRGYYWDGGGWRPPGAGGIITAMTVAIGFIMRRRHRHRAITGVKVRHAGTRVHLQAAGMKVHRRVTGMMVHPLVVGNRSVAAQAW
jgi:hypothetical protein